MFGYLQKFIKNVLTDKDIAFFVFGSIESAIQGCLFFFLYE